VGAVGSQSLLFRAVLDFLKALTVHRPVVVLLDDLHWSDPASLDLLRFLCQSLTALPLFILVTYRSEGLSRDHPLYRLLPLLVREANAERVDLRPLDDDAVRALVDARYGLADADALRLVAHLRQRAEGNSLFIAELLRSLEEELALRRTAGGWHLGELGAVVVPGLLRQLIDARVARLTSEAQRLLAVAAVLGHECPYTVWSAVADVEDGALLDAVAEAASAHVMVENRAGTGATFTHALVREALYEAVRPAERRRWHRRAGEALAGVTDADPDAVASHFLRAGDSRAAEWFVIAGERAQRATAWRTAAERYETALALMGQAAGTEKTRAVLHYRLAVLRRWVDPRQGIASLTEAERLATATGDSPLVASTRFNRGFLHVLNGDLAQGLGEMRTASDTLESLSGTEQGQFHPDPAFRTYSENRGTLLLWLAWAGRVVEAAEIGEQFVRQPHPPASRVTRDAVPQGEAYRGLGVAYALRGRPQAARDAWALARAADGAIEHYHNVGFAYGEEVRWVLLPYQTDRVDERHQFIDAMHAAYTHISDSADGLIPRLALLPVSMVEGDWTAMHTIAQVGLTYGHPLARNFVLTGIAPLARAQGEPALAWRHLRQVLPAGAATPPGTIRFDFAEMLQRLAVALALDGNDLDTATAWLHAHDQWLDWAGVVLGQSEGEALWAQYYWQASKPEQAREHAERALAHATEPRQPLALIAAHRLLGELDTEAGRFDDAATHLADSLALADACAAPYERALTLLARAELRVAGHRREEATFLLNDTRAILIPLGAQPALARVDALAANLAATHASPPTYPAGLSTREVEVLRLIAAGKSNREIAAALYLSPGTVNVHVTHILTKTNTSNRTEAAIFARDHGLA
jgi:DNA-binding CsgD family transcriptional regulator/tetratricopeptide (TPR) repeat protein